MNKWVYFLKIKNEKEDHNFFFFFIPNKWDMNSQISMYWRTIHTNVNTKIYTCPGRVFCIAIEAHLFQIKKKFEIWKLNLKLHLIKPEKRKKKKRNLIF